MIQLEASLQGIAKMLDRRLLPTIYGRKMGFALLVFPFDRPSGDYVSNARREDMVKAMREIADRIERNQDARPARGTF